MEFLGLTEDEVSYITLDLLHAPVGDSAAIEEMDMVGDTTELPAGAPAMAGVVPNRIWYMSEFTPGGFNPSRGNVRYFYANCDRRYRCFIFDTQIARREQAGYCGTAEDGIPFAGRFGGGNDSPNFGCAQRPS